MKQILILTSLLLMLTRCCAQAQAGPTNVVPSITLAWNASVTPNVTIYRVYYGVASGTYTNAVAVGTNLSLTLTNLVRGATYYFTATAGVASGLESDFCTEISGVIPAIPIAVPNFRILLIGP